MIKNVGMLGMLGMLDLHNKVLGMMLVVWLSKQDLSLVARAPRL